jgi:hypothetical protein
MSNWKDKLLGKAKRYKLGGRCVRLNYLDNLMSEEERLERINQAIVLSV